MDEGMTYEYIGRGLGNNMHFQLRCVGGLGEARGVI